MSWRDEPLDDDDDLDDEEDETLEARGEEEVDEEEGPEPDDERRQQNAERAREGHRRRQQELQLAAAGLAFDEQGRLAVINPQAAAGLSQQAAAAQQAATATVAAEPPAEMPDPTLEPEEFNAWMQAQRERDLAQMRQEFEARFGMVQEPVLNRAVQDAVALARETLGNYRLGFLPEHPDFDEKFAEALRGSGFPPGEWLKPAMLARIAGIVNVDLQDQPPPRRRRGEEDVTERRSPRSEDVQRAAISRGGYQQIGSSRGGGARPATAEQFSDEERRNARMIGVSVAEYRALGDETGDEYRREKDRSERRRQRQEAR